MDGRSLGVGASFSRPLVYFLKSAIITGRNRTPREPWGGH
jgi:hypothetical protein